MSAESRKSKVSRWGCLVCKCLKNSVLEKKCQICGAKRQCDRFGFSLMEVYYLCHVNTARAIPQVTISRLTAPESTVTVKLPMIQESLLDAVLEAVTKEATKVNAVELPPPDGPLTISINDGREEQKKPMDLYHKIMHQAKDLEYNVVMGQFVPVGEAAGSGGAAAIATAKVPSPNGSVSHKDLNYVQSMQRQKDVMDKVVKDTIQTRAEESDSPYTKDLNANEDYLNEWKAKVPCSLCGYAFPPAQLLGSISNQSILNWLKAHNASTDSKECKKMALQAYEAAKMCLFCTQFFDENCANAFDVELSANEEFRRRRKENKKQKKKETKEDHVIAKLNEKLSIAELKSKKESVGIRFRESRDEEVINAERILKLQSEKRSLNFQEAKEKFRRHKAALAKKVTADSSSTRIKSASDASLLPSVGRSKENSKEGNFTSRSAGHNAKKKQLKGNVSEPKLLKVRSRREKNTTTSTAKDSLPSIVPKKEPNEGNFDPEGDLNSVASVEASIDSIEEALHANNLVTNTSPKKKKKKKKNKEIIHRMTKKEIARLELLKEIAEKKLKEEKRYKSRKANRESDWSNVRVGNGGEEEDLKVLRDNEKRTAMLIEEYEREMLKQQQPSSKKTKPPESVIDRPDWDDKTVIQKTVCKPKKEVNVHKSAQKVSDDDESEDEYDDEYEDECEDEDDDVDDDIIAAEVEEKIETQQKSSLLFLKPTISLEMIQQHKKHLQAMHLKHLETHIDSKILEEQSRPLTKDAPVRTSISKDMLENHKKRVLSMQNKSITVSDNPIRKSVSPHKTILTKAKSVNQNSQKSKVRSSDNDEDEEVKVKQAQAPDSKITVHHCEDIDEDDGFGAPSAPFNSVMLRSSQEYADEGFEVESPLVLRDDDDDLDTPAMMDYDPQVIEEKTKPGTMLSTIVSQDIFDGKESAEDNIKKNDENEEDDDVGEITYNGFDSLMDSLQVKAEKAKVKHAHITLLNPATEVKPPSPKRRQVKVLTARKNSSTEIDEMEEEAETDSTKVNQDVVEEEKICDEISFDDEDDTPYDVDIYSASAIRCSPVTIDNDIEDEVDCKLNSRTSTPSKAGTSAITSLRGHEVLRSGGRARSRGQVTSPGPGLGRGGVSRGGSRRGGKSNRLDQYDNSRPSSKSSLRPLSRTKVTSSGSARKARASQRLEPYDNSVEQRTMTNDLESSGQFSISGLTSPPSSAVKRRKRSAVVNKLEVVVDKEENNASPKLTRGLSLSSPDAVTNRNTSSRSGVKKLDTVNTLEVVKSEVSGGGGGFGGGGVSVNKNAGTESVPPKKRMEAILPSNLEHRTQPKTKKSTNTDMTEKIVDSKIDQKEREHCRLPHRHESFAKISHQIDDTPSMLELSMMKFNGEVKVKRVDSFAKLSKRIMTQQKSPKKMVNKVRNTIVNGNAIYN